MIHSVILERFFAFLNQISFLQKSVNTGKFTRMIFTGKLLHRNIIINLIPLRFRPCWTQWLGKNNPLEDDF